MATNTKTKLWTRLADWVKTHKKLAIIITCASVAVIGVIVAVVLLINRPARTMVAQLHPELDIIKLPEKYYSPLTGVEVPNEAATKQAVTAIMIENSPSARPQSGIKQAGVVFEAIAEGGITRFLTLHQQDKPQMIGPVRSLRMYYVDWLAPYNASVSHVGGSFASLAEIRNGKYRDIDQFFNGAYYWRATDRWAPHNVYTSFEKLDALNASKGYTESTFTGFSRVDGKPSSQPAASSIAIDISGPAYNVDYTYDVANNHYVRSLGGEPHLDREDGQITPSVVIALKVDMVQVLEDGYRESITTIGSGGAVIFQNGNAQEVTWHKADRMSPLTFTNAAGDDVPLVRGQTWISAVPNGSGAVAWQ